MLRTNNGVIRSKADWLGIFLHKTVNIMNGKMNKFYLNINQLESDVRKPSPAVNTPATLILAKSLRENGHH